MPNSTGSSRLLVLLALVVSGMILAVGMVVLLAPDPLDDDVHEDDVIATPGTGDPGRVSRRGATDEDDDDGADDGIVTEFVGDAMRTPSGDVMPMSVERLGAAVDLWLSEPGRSEELRRCIYELQREGSVIPPEQLERILAKLGDEEFRQDAILALGMVKDATSGLRLAGIAADPTQSDEVRQAVLQALQTSGQAAGVSVVAGLLELPDTSVKVRRAALLALGGMGGAEASGVIADLLATHHEDDDLRSALLSAATLSKDVGMRLAELSRSATANGNVPLALAVMTVALQKGDAADDALRQEVLALVRTGVHSEAMSAEDQARIRATAVTAAARMGETDAVLAVVEHDIDQLRGIALNALRQTRGDAAAKQIVAFIERTGGETAPSRRDLLIALGETRSREATSELVRGLSSTDVNVRQAAAIGLQHSRDPAAVAPVLARLEAGEENRDVRVALVDALGRVGSRDALEKLEAWRDDARSEWQDMKVYVARAIARIRGGNPDSQQLDAQRR